jgi:hypothetical protein
VKRFLSLGQLHAIAPNKEYNTGVRKHCNSNLENVAEARRQWGRGTIGRDFHMRELFVTARCFNKNRHGVKVIQYYIIQSSTVFVP